MPSALRPCAMRNGRSCNRGFSLLELAIGLVIVATLLSALLVPLATQMDQRRVSETQKQLEMARDALIGYAISHGRLPCPAWQSTDRTKSSNGKEKFVPEDPPETGSATDGECLWMNGFLPAVTLGLSPLDGNGFFRDAYGTDRNRIRYAVSTANVQVFSNSLNCKPPSNRGAFVTTETRVVTRSRGMKAVGMQMLAQAADSDCEDPPRFLRVCTTANCAGTGNQVLSNYGAVAVIWSVGRNASDTGRTVPSDEQENLDENDDRDFVARERRDRKEGKDEEGEDVPDNEFDDIVLWISPSLLLSRMAAAGALP
jgi:prepilin-type N-terminal cleavage/methylation domain-containing protein